MAYIAVYSKTTTSVTVYLAELDTNYSYNDRRIDWCVGENTTVVAWTNIPAGVSKSDTATISGLSPNTTYKIYAKVYKSGAMSPFITFSKSVTTEKDTPTRPSKFSWTTPKEQGEPFYLTDTEWNNLTKNINDVRKYKNLSEYSFTEAVTGETFTADMHNEAVEAIKGISGYGEYLTEAKAGWNASAERLNYLVSEINSVP